MNCNRIMIAPLIGLVLFLGACTDPDGPANAEQLAIDVRKTLAVLEEDKEQTARQLRELRVQLTMHMTKAEEQLKDPALTPAQRTERSAFKNDVDQQLKRVDKGLDDVENATDGTWENVERGTQRAVKDVGDWVERQAENADRKSDADRARDGH